MNSRTKRNWRHENPLPRPTDQVIKETRKNNLKIRIHVFLFAGNAQLQKRRSSTTSSGSNDDNILKKKIHTSIFTKIDKQYIHQDSRRSTRFTLRIRNHKCHLVNPTDVNLDWNAFRSKEVSTNSCALVRWQNTIADTNILPNFQQIKWWQYIVKNKSKKKRFTCIYSLTKGNCMH